MLNADRFLALYFGIHYYVRVTKRKIKLLILLMPVICAVTTYFTFYDTNYSFGIHCQSLINWKNSTLSILGRFCLFVILILNIFFYVCLVTMMKSKDQRKVITKISVITGSVLVMCVPGLVVFIFLPKSENKTLYFYAVLPVIVKCLLNPFMYVWRYADSRFQLKMALCFWNKRAMEELEADRKDYYSSYQIYSGNPSHRKQHFSMFRFSKNKIDESRRNIIEKRV
jgi:hypothetical protein